MPVRPSLIVTLVLAALPLGCGGRVEMALVDPAKYTFYNCAQLQRDMTRLREQEQELKTLHDKVARDSLLVARVAYEADYLSTIGDMQLIETAARDRECNPAITIAADAPAR